VEVQDRRDQLERLVRQDLPGIQVFQEVRAVQALQDKLVPQEFRVQLVPQVLREIVERLVVSERPVFQVHPVRMDLTDHRAMRAVRDRTEALGQLDRLEHLGHLE